MNAPRLYGTFLLWMLSELFEQLPEIGDPEKPKMVFFFDEAHLLFNEAPKVLIERIELLVRLIRSKGVGVYFVTQNPLDVPDTVLGQLGNRVQHALRAFTPRDQKAVKATAQTMRGKAGLDIEKAITELGVGEALVSLLDAKGRPSETEQAYVLLPGSQLGPITPEQRQALLANSLVAGVYEQTLDRESAYERLKGAAPANSANSATGNAASAGAASGAFGQGASVANPPAGQAAAPSMTDQVLSGLGDALFGSTGPRGGQHQGLAQMMVKSAVRNIGSAVGREIVRGVMGSILGGRKR
jgi:DNA helicase HerA-like ATPase